MKIIYNENPLRTTVELDETDQTIFRLKIKVEELQDRLGSVQMSLEDGEYLDRAKKMAYSFEDFEENGVLNKRIDKLFNWYVEALKDTHCGDCTCAPASCIKCRAEEILGINTLEPYPGKHELSYIDSAFGKNNKKTLLEAIEYLKNYKVDLVKPESWVRSTQEEYESYIPGWEASAKKAYEYLKNYVKEKFDIVD
jgi:hypothetical protein